ncbi:low molecular weight protein-tyrosine-phosphatase [Lacimicrobium alkaliphilum]|uniref:protein-tyrosine-phosphatase n=1 Tax=Lacimicrobium alkaliphilum TaxID=1526571 RepID=A0ABQ1R329_9ALTE|nr:low molecular weight protein-tyrosine-phosphatase [Lacimicrobium alkaliphilum]GGD52918.1 protein-tyrosine-phosphatase [Lacimicrobium alkaliphilum]
MSQGDYSVLFVCLGNLCRSPTAHAIFQQKAAHSKLKVHIDSAGTSGFHVGSLPDKRTCEAGIKRGYDFTSQRSRAVAADDFERFDLILAMDQSNHADLLARCPEEFQHKVHLFLEYTGHEQKEVPDPYYGGRRGFDLVLDLVEQGCDKLIQQLRARKD